MAQGRRFEHLLPGILLLVMACLATVFVGCDSGLHRGVHLFLEEPFPKKLSAWHLFAGAANEGHLTPNTGVLPYDLNTPLFSDYADKYRFVWMPAGSSAEYKDDAPFEFPIGTIFVKSFAFPVAGRLGEERLIETRLLVRTKSAWVPLPYIWNAGRTEATLQLVPDPVRIRYTDAAGRGHDFTYQIPNTNECHECHDNNKVLQPIGPKARNLTFPSPSSAQAGDFRTVVSYCYPKGYQCQTENHHRLAAHRSRCCFSHCKFSFCWPFSNFSFMGLIANAS